MKNNELFDLTGKVALVTGSTKGIGRAIAEAFAAHGAKVVVSSRKAPKCEEVAASINTDYGEAIAVPCNISRIDELRALVDRTLEHWGRIDVLVCNAAVNPYYGPLVELDEGAYAKTMDSNVKSNLWLCNMVIPQMAEREDGAVIITASIGGLKGTGNLGLYAITKAADMQLARSLAVEWGPKNIRVNCLAPGIIRTDMARLLWEDPAAYDKAIKKYPLGRIGEPEEVAGAAVLLASRAGAFITGQTIVIDGGHTIMGDG